MPQHTLPGLGHPSKPVAALAMAVPALLCALLSDVPAWHPKRQGAQKSASVTDSGKKKSYKYLLRPASGLVLTVMSSPANHGLGDGMENKINCVK